MVKKGDVVEIHEDPYSREHSEGKAELRKVISYNERHSYGGQNFNEWHLMVRLLSDGYGESRFRCYCEPVHEVEDEEAETDVDA